MKAWKRIISLLLTLTITGSLIAVPAAAEETGTESAREQSVTTLLASDRTEEAAVPDGQTNPSAEAALSVGDVTNTPESTPDESAAPDQKDGEAVCVHQWLEWRVEAGCTRAGAVFQNCKLCGEQEKLARLEPLGHKYESSVTRQPTAYGAGLRTYTCTVCGKRYTEEIAQLTEEGSSSTEAGFSGNVQQKECEHLHRTVTNSEAATCTQEGRLLSRCLDCGTEGLVMTVIPKLDHSYTSTVTKEATETSEGIRTYTCTVCRNSYTEKLPMLTAAQHQGAWTSGLSSVSKLSKDEITALLAKYPTTMPNVVFDEKPNCTAPYSTGTVNSTALNAAADRLNALRQLAGLKPVTLDQEWCDLAQYGAVILGELGDLNHTPKKPADMDSSFYKKAYTATSTSNLYGGEKLTATPDGFMDDSDASNVSRVGHRRWQLNPDAVKVGFGYVDNGAGYRKFTCERVFSSGERSTAQNTDYDFIGWPASGNFPSDTSSFTGTTAWSVSLNPQRFAQPKLSDLTVTIQRESDGRIWTLSGSYSAADSGAYLNVNNGSYGSGYCIIFRPDGVSRYDGVYTVSIDGLRTKQGAAVENFTYEVDFFETSADQAEESKTTPVTETDPDGSVTVTETQANGGIIKTTTTTNGTTATVTTDAHGSVTTASSTVSATAARSGQTVTLPLGSVTAASDSASALKINVTLPAGSSSIRVEFPVKNAGSGTVVVLVNRDGTETIVPTTQRTQNGVSVKLEGSATVKIVDNTKQFSDVPSSNVFYHEIRSMSARNIMVGKTSKTFDLYANVTLNQIANVAGRISGAVSVADYAGGVNWARGKGLSTGDQPAARGDVLKALYIAAGSPRVSDQGQLDKFTDGSSVSAELLNAALWAVESGVLKGNLDGTLELSAHVTRGQTAAFAGRALDFMA